MLQRIKHSKWILAGITVAVILGTMSTTYANTNGYDANFIAMLRQLIQEEIKPNTGGPVATSNNPAQVYNAQPQAQQNPQTPATNPHQEAEIQRLKLEIEQMDLELQSLQAKAEWALRIADKAQSRLDSLGKPMLGINWRNEQDWVYVTGTPNIYTAAHRAGIRGDVFLTHINDERITPQNMRDVLWQYVPNEVVTVTYRTRTGQTKTTTVRLDRDPNA